MTSCPTTLDVARIPRRGWREPILFLCLIATAATPRSSGDGQTGSGCDGRASHIGLAGALGGGTIMARVCGQGDNLARLGSRSADDLLQLGGPASRTAGNAADGLDGFVGASRVDEIYDSQWEEAAEIVGRLVSESDIEKYPGYWKDTGVDLYLSNPQKWADLGGDELLAMAAVRSPAMRSAMKRHAKAQFDDALRDLSGVENVGPRTIERVRERYGVELIEGPGQTFQLEYRTADFVYRLLDTLIEEEPISERAWFPATQAEQDLREAGAEWVTRVTINDVAGLYCFAASWPDAEDDRQWHHWVGPGVVLSREDPADFDRLVALLSSGKRYIEAAELARLWTAFHRPVHATVCPIWLEVAPPRSLPLREEILYKFSTHDLEDDTCRPREVRIALDRTEEIPDSVEPEGEDQGRQPGSGVGTE